MNWGWTPYFLVILYHVWTCDALGLVRNHIWHLSKYLILAFYDSGQFVALGELGFDNGAYWESCEYQCGS